MFSYAHCLKNLHTTILRICLYRLTSIKELTLTGQLIIFPNIQFYICLYIYKPQPISLYSPELFTHPTDEGGD